MSFCPVASSGFFTKLCPRAVRAPQDAGERRQPAEVQPPIGLRGYAMALLIGRSRQLLAVAAPLCVATLLLPSCKRVPHTAYAFELQPRVVFQPEEISGSRDPKLDVSSSGMLSMLIVYKDRGESRLGFTMSHDGGDHFMTPIPVSPPGSAVQSHGENSPTLIALPTAIYALWEQAGPGGASDLVLARSLSFGQSFDRPVRVTDEETPAFHGFSSVAAAPDGSVYAVWLDGREKDMPPGTFALYVARSEDNGGSFGDNHRVALSACPCCRPRVAVGPTGEVYVAWRKVFDGDVRDMVVSTSKDGGDTFAPEVRVADDGWQLRGCPDSGPALVTSGNRLYIAWLTEGRERRPRIQIAWSDDQAAHFHAAIEASHDSLDANHPVLTASEDGHVLLAYQARGRNADGGWEPLSVFVADVTGDQVSVPQPLANGGATATYPNAVAGTGGRVYVTWTRHTDQGSAAVLLRGRRAPAR